MAGTDGQAGVLAGLRVGVEVGGTFTDLVAIGPDGLVVTKVPSTPSAPDQGAIAALDRAFPRSKPLAQVDDLVHGSTVATNAILERKGARVAFLVTRGFRDILFLQRHNRRQIYDLAYRKPAPVVRRRDCFEIDERMAADGSVVDALDEAGTRAAIQEIFGSGAYDAAAVCLLNAYANPSHERQVRAWILAAFPALNVTTSEAVTREFREFERASTTTLAAYVQPVIDAYLQRLGDGVTARGFAGRFSVMQSNGGRLPAAAMAQNAITSLFSGPAAGVMGAVRQAGLSGYGDIITFDMGGTSTDVCLVAGGTPALAAETEVDGLPIRTPVLDIVTVGAGGGSLAWIDDGGLLRVGPESAGAEPGPACYGRGGTAPTITDAHMIRGTIRAEAFLAGEMTVAADAANAAYRDLADSLGQSVEAAADSAIRVAEANIVGAIRLVSTERGRDPRDYVLVPFGGAGPLHAARVAEALGIQTLLVPPNAGVLSAYGLLAADFVQYATRTQRLLAEAGIAQRVRDIFAEMEAELTDAFLAVGLTARPAFSYFVDMRFVGQAFEVAVALPATDMTALDDARLLEKFYHAHDQVFAFGKAERNPVEVVSFRLGAAAPSVAPPGLSDAASAAWAGTDRARIFDSGAWLDTQVHRRATMPDDPAAALAGPLLVEDGNATIFVPAGWQGWRDAHHNLIFTQTQEPNHG